MDVLKFMGRESLIEFTVNAQRLKDEVTNYQETYLSQYFPNLYTKKYLEISDAITALVDVLQDEVATQSKQLGIEEGIGKIKFWFSSKPKKPKRRKVKRKIKKTKK